MKKTLRKSEVRELNQELERFGFELGKKQRVEVDEGIISVDGTPRFFRHDKKLVPLLKEMPDLDMRKVVVDMPAVSFMVKGADVMRPGITMIDDGIAKGDPVLVVDERHGKALAVGIALFSSEEMRSMEKGKVIENIHHVGDTLWDA